MPLYIVTADTYNEDYGSVIELLCLSNDKNFAKEVMENAEKAGWNSSIIEIHEENLNKQIHIVLGGYIG